ADAASPEPGTRVRFYVQPCAFQPSIKSPRGACSTIGPGANACADHGDDAAAFDRVVTRAGVATELLQNRRVVGCRMPHEDPTTVLRSLPHPRMETIDVPVATCVDVAFECAAVGNQSRCRDRRTAGASRRLPSITALNERWVPRIVYTALWGLPIRTRNERR